MNPSWNSSVGTKGLPTISFASVKGPALARLDARYIQSATTDHKYRNCIQSCASWTRVFRTCNFSWSGVLRIAFASNMQTLANSPPMPTIRSYIMKNKQRPGYSGVSLVYWLWWQIASLKTSGDIIDSSKHHDATQMLPPHVGTVWTSYSIGHRVLNPHWHVCLNTHLEIWYTSFGCWRLFTTSINWYSIAGTWSSETTSQS